MPLSDVEKLCSIVSCLGGPSYTPSELEWATQIAPGKVLIEWVAAQLPLEDRNIDDEYWQRTVLSRIALEDEELKLLQHSKPTTSDSKVDFSNYIPPSRQSSRMTLNDNNAYTLEQEALLLQHRLRLTKSLSQQLQETAQTITAELLRVESSTVQKQQELELQSLKADTVISDICSKSFDLLKRWQEDLLSTSSNDYLANCLDTRARITRDVTEQLDTIETWKDQQLPTAAHLKDEALRLQHAFGLNKATDSNLLSLAEQSAYWQQLKSLIGILEEVNGDDGEIYDVLQQFAIENNERSYAPLDIVKELELAWNMDQFAILEARNSILNRASSHFQQSILPPLQKIHDFLVEKQSVIQETLAILGAFEQEMDSVVQEVNTAESKSRARNSSQDPSSDVQDRRGSALYSDLKTLLKDLQNLRPSNMPPLILLDENDVLLELRALKEIERALSDQDEKWCTSIPTALNSLMNMHDPALNATYAHSAVNTSAPFQLSPSVDALQHDAEGKGDALAREVHRLQKDMKIVYDDKTQRKLKFFVERWNSLP